MGSKLTDSPWFWLYLFAMSGLILLWVSAPTWIERQTRWERRRTARDLVGIERSDRLEESGWETADRASEDLAREAALRRWRTLVVLVAGLATAGALGGWWRRFRRGSAGTMSAGTMAEGWSPSSEGGEDLGHSISERQR